MDILIVIHILAGKTALLSAALAVLSERGKKFHVISGRTYFWRTVCIFLTAIPMSIISSNIFLCLIAIFSFYLAFAGTRFAKNRKGIATRIDWIAVSLMILSGAGMWALAVIYFISDNSQYITLFVFGFIALAIGYGDITPDGDVTQMLSVSEGLIGQFYLAILVARMVSVYAVRAKRHSQSQAK